MKKFFLIIALVMSSQVSWAQKKGGTFNLRMTNDPVTLHPIMASDLVSSEVHGYVLETLLTQNPDTYELEPNMAEKYEVSKDGMEFTFWLREGMKWHDGKPITAEDVKFSFEAIFNPEFKAAHLIPYFENIGSAEVIDARTIKFKAKKKYFNNLNVVSLSYYNIVPKHIYQDVKNKKLNKELTGSGPYKFASWDRGKKITLKRNLDWWGWNVPALKDQYNFDTINFRIVKDDNVALEMFKKGDIDFIDMTLTPEVFVKKTEGPLWGKKLIKVKTENKSPKGYGFIGWNERRPIFQDKKLRHALQLLINRPLMNEKFRYGMSLFQAGPIYASSDYASPNVKPMMFEPNKALELLKEAGWKDEDKNGVLEKALGGKKTDLKFTIMTANEDTLKYLTIIKEDAKKVGVDIDIKHLEWNSFMKLIDEGNFDGVAMGWGGGSVDPDPKQIWHSSSATEGGSNFVYYKNPEVDKLIDQYRETMDKKKRIELFRKMYEIVADDAPYAWLFSPKYTLYVHNSKIKKHKDTYQYTYGSNYWWME